MSYQHTPPAEQPKEVFSTANHIQLLQWKPEAYAGIDPSRNLVIYLNEGKIIGFEGDQGTGKTSLLECLITHLGGEEVANSQHVTIKEGKVEKARKSSLTFKDTRTPNITYEIKVGKSSVTIKKMEDVEGTIVSGTVDSPKNFLWNTFGPIGVSPMKLKEMDGKKQIEWIRNLYKFTADQLKKEQVIKTKYKTKFDERTGVNRDVTRLYKEVGDTGYYTWDKDNSTWVPSPLKEADQKFVSENTDNEEEITKQFEKANQDMQQLTAAKTRLEQRNVEKKQIVDEIAELERKLAAKKEELTAKVQQIETATQYIEQLKNAPEELENIREKMQRVGDVKLKKQNLATSEAKVKEYDEKQEQQIQLNADLDELKIDRKNFIKQFTPDIEGLELVVHDGIDNTEKKEGMYFNGRTPAEMSESELWDIFMQILRSVKCYFICIENLSSLGTAAIERINWFVKEGHGQVFYTAMQRGQKEMKVTMHTEIPV